MTLFLIEYTAYGIRVTNYDYHMKKCYWLRTKKALKSIL